MKIGIISDTHDRLDTLEKALKYINEQKAEALIHAGDLAHADTLEFICKKFHGDIYYIGGNADVNFEDVVALQKIYSLLRVYVETAELEIGGLKIAVTHKPTDAKRLAASKNYDLVIHGHDHKPWQSFVGACEVLNPGNIADVSYPATFAVYDTELRKASLIQVARLGK